MSHPIANKCCISEQGRNQKLELFFPSKQGLDTQPFDGQKPGTSGLRQKTRVFMQKGYLENFVQSVFDTAKPTNIVIGGDGRYFNLQACQTILVMAYANDVEQVWVGKDALLSTPAVSAVIRRRGAHGGFILSASHNPGGLDQDFGIKYNGPGGGPAPESVTDAIYEKTKTIGRYRTSGDFPTIDLSTTGSQTIGGMKIVVVDTCEDHLAVLQSVFDFPAIRSLCQRSDFSFLYDAMYGVQGPYARKIFVDILGLPSTSLLHCDVKEDFGGPNSPHHGHADPNLTHARALCDAMGVDAKGLAIPSIATTAPKFGAAADGDADRNMILGPGFFVSPSDSIALLVAHAHCIPWFARSGGIKGCARSMPTSRALDVVAEANNIPFFEVPTGWKFFGNLMDSGKNGGEFSKKPSYSPFMCGEESFGTGADHLREKDGMWAALAWMQILAYYNSDNTKPFVGIEEIVRQHWAKYGRHYYARYDYEGVDKKVATDLYHSLAEKAPSTTSLGSLTVAKGDVFCYEDPVDGSISRNQGIRFLLADGSRVVFRLSGTGVVGATIRIYLEKYTAPGAGPLDGNAQEEIKPLAVGALAISQIPQLTGLSQPSVIT
eukprot:GEMP01017982.1.p1 GENE.GEMP01017982.1~~GEMP01017982.1.p1  ORF type:complete len:604 (+),score=148.27 GEMP01017982.1:141-1952(+)